MEIYKVPHRIHVHSAHVAGCEGARVLGRIGVVAAGVEPTHTEGGLRVGS